MGAFDRAKKLLPLGNKNKRSSGGDDFNFDEFDNMDGDFDDGHSVSPDRKSTIKSYVKDHYHAKVTDSAERKRLLKAALPSSYSGTVDLASDLKGDYDNIRYEVGREWDKQSGSVKKTLKAFEKQLKFLKMNKAVEWANSSSGRGSYQEDEVSQNEALVSSLMGDFPGPQSSKALKIAKDRHQTQLKEKENVEKYRSESLSAQLRGTVSSEQSVNELRKLTNYQDQITYNYQKKSLEMLVRTYVESKTQTEILRTYKDESIAELKEIHKNTGLPEVVKINQSEFAAQAFKEKMMGNIVGAFDGKLESVRKRVTSRVRDKLTGLVKEVGSNLENLLGMSGADDEQGGGGIAKMFMSMGADALLDKPYNKAANSITAKIRNKLMGNRRIAKAGRGMQSVVSGLGGNVNQALLTGESGNGLIDSIMDFFGGRQAAVTRSDKLRGSMRDNLDQATFMDVKFKQTVERVIPGWLKLIHKENYLIRTQQTEDKNFKDIEWDWTSEKFKGSDEIRQTVMSRVFNREKVIETAEAYDGLMNAFGAFGLPPSAQEKLRDWLRKRVSSSMAVSPFYLYLERVKVFGRDDAVAFEQLADVMGHLGDIDEDMIDSGVITEGVLRFNNSKYGAWAIKTDAAYKRLTHLDVFDRGELQRLYDEGMGHWAEELGAAVRNEDGSVSINNDFADGIFKKYGRKEHKQTMFFKDGEARNVKQRGKNKSVLGYEVDESKTDSNWEDAFYDEYTLANNDANRKMNSWITDDVIAERMGRKNKAALARFLDGADTMTATEAANRGMTGRFTRASGGYIPSFAAGGGPTGDKLKVDDEIHVKMHGKEFVTDKETTEKNRTLLEFMNKFKAPVVLPDGSVNPIYYKAFGFKTEEAFKNADTDTSLSREQSRFFKSIQNSGDNASAYKLVTELFTALDLNRISDKDLKTLSSNKTPLPEKFKLFLEIRKNQAKSGKGKGKASGFAGNILSTLASDKPLGGRGSKLSTSVKSFFAEAKAEIMKMSDEQADIFVNKALGTLDESTLSDADLEVLTDPSVSTKDKALLIAKLTTRRGDKKEVTTKAVKDALQTVKKITRSKIKSIVNGGTDDTTNSDNLKIIGNKLSGKMGQGKDYAKSKLDIIKQLAEGGQLDDKAKEYASKVLVKLRMDKAAGLGLKLWKDNAIDIYLGDDLEFPRLNALAFANGAYIDKETGRVLATHHDITGPVIDQKGNFVLTAADFTKGLVDKEGNPIFINSLKRFRNLAKEKASAMYNKYGKKYVDKGIDGFLSMSEKWQALFKKTDIDIYIGEGKEPRLTAAGFREGKYLSVLKKKPLKGYLDIDGPVMTADGTIVITTEEISSSAMHDKDGNIIRPPKLMSNMGRLGSLVWNALSFDKAYNVGKKAFGKLKGMYTKWKGKSKGEGGDEFMGPSLPGAPKAKGFGSGIKDKLKSLAGYESDDEGNSSLRVGSWQWKRKQKDKDGWMSKFAGMFGRGKDTEGEKKKGILGKLLGIAGSIAGGIFTLGNSIGKIFSGSLMKMAKWIVPSLGKNLFKALGWIGKPILGSLAFIGKSIGSAITGRGLMGNGVGGLGRMAKIGGLAAGGYMTYSALKGTDKVDENGQPVLDENGEAVKERDWGGAAMGAATMALSTGKGLAMAGRGLMAAGTIARVGMGLLTGPVGWAALGATAAYYGGKLALGKWKKGQAAKDSPILAFRMNQYGFDLTDEKSTSSLMQLESVLQPNVVVQGDKANFKSEMDVESVFGVFGLKYEGGDAERNKKFLTWFLGRFKPIYLAYIRTLSGMKKGTDLADLDNKLSAADRITLLDKVHFKNLTDMNPYSIKVSPFEDPDETDYDFEDMESRYKKTKSILDDKLSTEAVAAGGKAGGKEEAAKAEEKEASLMDSVKTGLKYGGVTGGIVGGSIFALKKLSSAAGDIFNKTTEGIGKSVGGFMDSMMSKVSGMWEKVKSFGSNMGDSISEGASNLGSQITESGAKAASWIGNIGNSGNTIETLVQAAQKAGINDPEELAMLLAQAHQESGGFKYSREFGENGYFKKYDNRKDLGNGPGDGAKYKGRGWIQITGKANYAAFSKWSGVDVVSKPELLEKEPYATMATIWFWTQHPNMTSRGRRAAQEGDVTNATKAVNGGTNHLDNRKKFYAKYIEMVKAGKIPGMGGEKEGGSVGSPAQSTGVMKPGASGTPAPAGVKSQAGQMLSGANSAVASSGSVGGGVLKPGAPAGSAKVVSSPVPTKAASTPTGAAGTALAKATPDLIALGKKHYALNKPSVSLNGMHPTFMNLFWAMIGEAAKKGLAKILITEGVRDIAEQKRLYALYKAGKGALAAVPGKSRHGYGEAMDINTPNADALEKSGLMAKYGFSRPLMKRLPSGKMTETWHIENKFVPNKNGASGYGKYNDDKPVSVASSTPSIDNVSYQDKNGKVTQGSSSNGISDVMNSGGFASTPNVSSAQRNDGVNSTATNNILKEQLGVQTQIRDTLVEIKNFIIKPQSELDQLKKPSNPENIGSAIGTSISEALAERLGLNKAADKPKPAAVISASK